MSDDDDVICLSPESPKVPNGDEVVCLPSNGSHSSKKKKIVTKSTETSEERAERKKKALIEKLEQHLKTLERHIIKWDEKEVDLDDDKNSAYLVRTRMVNKYIKYYKILCKEAGANSFTGRPIEKRIKIAEEITCPEIQEAVEKFLNGKEILFIPDYHDIEDIVKKVNDSSRPPLIAESDVSSIARKLFEEAMRILRFRRRKDFDIAVPLETTTDDPAEDDLELAKKLEENERVRGSEQIIVEKFVKLQEEENQNAVEVNDENPDASAGESDDESDEDFLEAEGGQETDDNGEINGIDVDAAKADHIDSRDQADEDDDEEEESVEESVENLDKEDKEESPCKKVRTD